MTSNKAPRAFPPTRWSVVLAARQQHSPESVAALETICRAYWFPLYAFVRRSGQVNGWWNVRGQAEPDRLLTLQASTNLLDWASIAVLFDKPTGVISNSFNFLDAATPNFRQRFYRCLTTVPGETNDWKNQVRFPDDPFLRKPGWQEAQDLRWVKFAILLNDPSRVVYQDSTWYLLHYDFAVARLEPFHGLSRTAFDEVSLYRTNQQVVLGSLLFPPAAVVSNNIAEYGIQLTRRDPYPREYVCQLLELVRSTVASPGGTVAYYFPAFEQTEAAVRDETYFAQQGIKISTPQRWVSGDHVYSIGWALGWIKFVPAAEINAAYSAGRLASANILLTDGVPAEIPFVSGIVTLTPATPNSHVAIQANAYRTPFAYVASPAQQERVRQLAGREVAYQTSVRWSLSVVDKRLPGQDCCAGLLVRGLRTLHREFSSHSHSAQTDVRKTICHYWYHTGSKRSRCQSG